MTVVRRALTRDPSDRADRELHLLRRHLLAVNGASGAADALVHQGASEIAGPGAQLVYDRTANRFDVLPLLVATDGAIAAFGRDGRRLRPNLVIGGVEGLDEFQWPGSRLVIGDVIIEVDSRRGR